MGAKVYTKLNMQNTYRMLRIKEEHMEHVRKLLQRLREAGLYAKLTKYEFPPSECVSWGL